MHISSLYFGTAVLKYVGNTLVDCESQQANYTLNYIGNRSRVYVTMARHHKELVSNGRSNILWVTFQVKLLHHVAKTMKSLLKYVDSIKVNAAAQCMAPISKIIARRLVDFVKETDGTIF